MPTQSEIKEFSGLIEGMAKEEGIGYMDAICHHCNETGLEVEMAATLISAALKSKIREEAQELNLLKKTSKLPI
jgi:enoyl-[acyl-carrier-protein] reductase (NADH)